MTPATQARQRSNPRRSRGGRFFALVCWPPILLVLALSAAWPFSGLGWRIDLAANLTAQWLALAFIGAVLAAAMRRRSLLVVAMISAASCLTGLSLGRAAFLPRPIPVTRDPQAAGMPPPQGEVRFLHYNASTKGDGQGILDLVRLVDADVTSIACPPVRMQNVVIDGHDLEDQFPGKLVRHWRPEPNGGTTEVTAGFVVSRWPITPLDTHDLGAAGDYLIAGAVQRPEGPFAVIAVHPRSPRTAARWEVGNAVIEAVATLTRRMAEQGLPVVVLSDLNSTPTGYRSRHLYQQAKLRRAKPLFSWTATYPDQITWGSGPTRSLPLAWPAAIAIDDALITPGIGVSGWTVGPRLASEHLPVIVELTIPQGSVPNPASPPSTPLPAGR